MAVFFNRYNYQPLQREESVGQRLYVTPDGCRVPSVTTILAKTTPAHKKQALADWRNRVGAVQASQIVIEAAGRGTRMHKFLENYILQGSLSPPGSNPYSQQSHVMAKSIIDNGFPSISEIWGTEINLYYPELYAGTSDSCGVHLSSESVFDYKQSNKLKQREWIEDYFLQLVFYACAHNKLHGTDIKKGVIFMSVKPELTSPGVWGDPKYQEFVLEGQEWNRYQDKVWDRLEQYYQNA